MLKEYIINSPGCAWIERFNAPENDRELFWAWSDHYNGQEKFSKRNHMALATLKTLHCKKEQSMAFENNSETLRRDFATLDKDL